MIWPNSYNAGRVSVVSNFMKNVLATYAKSSKTIIFNDPVIFSSRKPPQGNNQKFK